jgi:hypothetical protein
MSETIQLRKRTGLSMEDLLEQLRKTRERLTRECYGEEPEAAPRG